MANFSNNAAPGGGFDLLDLIERKDAAMEREHAMKAPVDNGGRRLPDTERRAYAYTAHIPERRKGGDRRSGKDRRKH